MKIAKPNFYAINVYARAPFLVLFIPTNTPVTRDVITP